MLVEIPLLICLLFATIYPLFFWTNRRRPIAASFYQFNLGLGCVVASLAVMVLWMMDTASLLKGLALFWALAFLVVTGIFWGKEKINETLICLPSLLGFYLIYELLNLKDSYNIIALGMTLLGGGILCGAIYAAVLGHWYLNLRGLPLDLFRVSTWTYLVLIIIRLLLTGPLLLKQKVMYAGEPISVLLFLKTFDGALVYLAIFFGLIFPFILSGMALKTIKLKNTQSATGILYVVVCSLLIGEFVYRYYSRLYGLIL